MKVIIVATEEQKQEIITYKIKQDQNSLHFIQHIEEIQNYKEFDAFFLLTDTIPRASFEDYSGKPVVINSVTNTLKSLNLPSNFTRINGWPGFLKRPVYEVAANDKNKTAALFEAMGWDVLYVKDEPGLVAARVISMIINEAYFALGEKVSTISEIDLAMQLGTNYPMGPFEWEAKIGIQKIYMLLKKLSEKDKRYLIAPALEEKFKKIISSQFS
ncbi:MAG: 3-hydroxyacyl-CoA dehydrogenase family protein [Ginsengibacter sp.]